jgi:hypothetical protein
MAFMSTMPKKREMGRHQTWTCPFCQQRVPLEGNLLKRAADFDERCLLPEHIADGECVAFRDPRKARELLIDI